MQHKTHKTHKTILLGHNYDSLPITRCDTEGDGPGHLKEENKTTAYFDHGQRMHNKPDEEEDFLYRHDKQEQQFKRWLFR